MRQFRPKRGQKRVPKSGQKGVPLNSHIWPKRGILDPLPSWDPGISCPCVWNLGCLSWGTPAGQDPQMSILDVICSFSQPRRLGYPRWPGPKCRSWTVFVPFLRFASWGIPAGRVAGISNLDVFHSFFKSQNGHMDPPGPKMSKIAKSRKPTRHEVVRTTWIVAWLTATVRIHVPNREQFIYSSGNSYPKWRFWVWKYRKPAKLTIQPSWIFRKRPFWPFLAKIKCLLGLFTPLRGPFWPFLAKRVKKGQKWPKMALFGPQNLGVPGDLFSVAPA